MSQPCQERVRVVHLWRDKWTALSGPLICSPLRELQEAGHPKQDILRLRGREVACASKHACINDNHVQNASISAREPCSPPGAHSQIVVEMDEKNGATRP